MPRILRWHLDFSKFVNLPCTSSLHEASFEVSKVQFELHRMWGIIIDWLGSKLNLPNKIQTEIHILLNGAHVFYEFNVFIFQMD